MCGEIAVDWRICREKSRKKKVASSRIGPRPEIDPIAETRFDKRVSRVSVRARVEKQYVMEEFF